MARRRRTCPPGLDALVVEAALYQGGRRARDRGLGIGEDAAPEDVRATKRARASWLVAQRPPMCTASKAVAADATVDPCPRRSRGGPPLAVSPRREVAWDVLEEEEAFAQEAGGGVAGVAGVLTLPHRTPCFAATCWKVHVNEEQVILAGRGWATDYLG